MQDQNIKGQQWWEDYFSVGGWEQNDGRNQTRIFAEEFTKRLHVDRSGNFSLLDIGCALGDAVRHFSKEFPNARLYGVDFSSAVIERCQSEHKDIASFSVADFASIEGHYDIIYCSNTLEHFTDYQEKARQLTKHCDRLCLLVPLEELKDGRPLQPDPLEHHQYTFYKDSFDYLLEEGLASRIDTTVFSCPGAWGWGRLKKFKEMIRNYFRSLTGRPVRQEPRQIFYDIRIK